IVSLVAGVGVYHRPADFDRRRLDARRRGLSPGRVPINFGDAAMGLVGFGQPDDGIIQMCYLVPDIRAAMSVWIDKLKVGPWFLLDHFTGIEPKYRGRDSTADVSLAMSFAGHMN